jgi:hypothetical protein
MKSYSRSTVQKWIRKFENLPTPDRHLRSNKGYHFYFIPKHQYDEFISMLKNKDIKYTENFRECTHNTNFEFGEGELLVNNIPYETFFVVGLRAHRCL